MVCGGLGLLFPLPTAGEIFPVGTLLPVPHTQRWFMGVANLRGGLHTFALPVATPELSIAMFWHPRFQGDGGHGWFRGVVTGLVGTSGAELKD